MASRNESDIWSSTLDNTTTNGTVSKCVYVPSNLQFVEYLYNVYIALCVVNAVFAPLAVFGNAIVFYSIYNTNNLHDPAHVLLAILSLTDLAVGLLQQPIYVISKAAEINNMASVSCISGLINNMLAGIIPSMSFCIVTVITVDRFLALHLHLRYTTIVTRSLVVKVIVGFFLLFSAVVSFYPWKPRVPLFFAIVVISLFLTISCVLYVKIFRIVRKHQIAISNQSVHRNTDQSENKDLNMKKYWKFVVNFSYVYAIMILCFLPYVATLLTRGLVGITKEYKASLNITSTVIFINSTLNPLVYCWKIAEIKRAVFKTIRNITGIQFGAGDNTHSSSYM